jgi:hypothetical protein
MSDRPIYQIARGAEYSSVLASQLGESVSDLSVTAPLHRLPGGRNSSTPESTASTSFAIEPFAGDDDLGPGWYLSLTAAQTEALERGIYQFWPQIIDGSNAVVNHDKTFLIEVFDV